MLRLSDITAGYGDGAPLFAALSLSIAAGELRLVQGPSGCGKSTLLGIICGTAPSQLSWSGAVTLNGRAIGSLPAEQRRVGLMFQDA
ncbi:MAG: ATP-binding cassette domain-containing protein, partial [Pseudomonadota bacterium]|nr:ATP-binding cassette domain-containing protein [Pseudomonadota bacterium]